MGESSRFLMRSFSQPSSSSCEFNEGEPLRALTSSISFGRFMTEPLAWEKWSAFNPNRIREEVERFSKPGSVAEKKAYFEAHYKKVKAMKAAASLEPENVAPTHSPEQHAAVEIVNISPFDSDLAKSNIEKDVDVTQGDEVTKLSPELVSSVYEKDSNINDEEIVPSTTEVELVEAVTEQEVLSENNMQVEFSNELENIENDSNIMHIQDKKTWVKDAAREGDKLLSSRKKPAISSSKILTTDRASKLQTCLKPPTPVRPSKEDTATSNGGKTARYLVEKKRPAPQSLHMSINFASPAGENSKLSSPLLHKIGNSRNVKAFAKVHKEKQSLQALTRVSVNELSKHSLVPPQPEKRRSRTPLDRSCIGSRTVTGKSQSLSTNSHSGSLGACAKNPRTTTVPSTFSFRSEQRAVKRKEFSQRLQEKHNTKEAEKVQPQAKSKEKAETDLKIMRQSTSLKAKPSPSFHREIELPTNNMKKIPPTQPRSPKQKRAPSAVPDTCYRPPWSSSPKTDHSKNVIRKNRSHSITSLPKKNMRENATPNIQPSSVK